MRRDANGLELTLVVADKLQFAPNEDITLEVSFVNTGSSDLYRNAAQAIFFEFIGASHVWTTSTCQPDFGGQRPPPTAIPIEPDEANRFVGTYPAAPGYPRREGCRLPAGEYDVYGIVDVCPPETVTKPRGGGQTCDSETDVPIRSEPLRITIG